MNHDLLPDFFSHLDVEIDPVRALWTVAINVFGLWLIWVSSHSPRALLGGALASLTIPGALIYKRHREEDPLEPEADDEPEQ